MQKNKYFIILNNKGFSLIAAIMLSGILILGNVTLLNLFQRHKNMDLYKAESEEATALVDEIKYVLVDEISCNANLGGSYITQDKGVTVIRREADGSSLYETEAANPGSTYKNSQFKLESMRMSGFTEDSPGSIYGVGQLDIAIKSLRGASKGRYFLRKIPIWLKLDGTGQNIISCGVEQEELVWRKSGDSIFYAGGNVGVGSTVSNPKADLDLGAYSYSGTSSLILGTEDPIQFRITVASNTLLYPVGSGDLWAAIDTRGGGVPVYLKPNSPTSRLNINEPNPELSDHAVRIRSNSAVPHLTLRKDIDSDNMAWQFTVDDDDADLNISRQGGGGVFQIANDDVRVGIGPRPSVAYNFYVQGKAGGTSAWSVASDYKLKKDIKPIENALQSLSQIGVYTYKMKSDPSGLDQIGFITQEIEKVYPPLVSKGEVYDSMNYAGMNAVAVEAFKELNSKIDSNTKQLDDWLDRL